MKDSHRRSLNRALCAAGISPRWIPGCVLLIFVLGVLFVDVFVRPAPPIELVSAAKIIDRALASIEQVELEISQPDPKEFVRIVTELEDLIEQLLRATALENVHPKNQLAHSIQRTLISLQSTHLSVNSTFKKTEANLRASLNLVHRSLVEKQRELDSVMYKRKTFMNRLIADLIGIAQWLTPYGFALMVLLFFLIFLVPHGELLKPLSTLTTRLRGLTIQGVRIDLSPEIIRSEKSEIQYAVSIIDNLITTHYKRGVIEFDIGAAFERFLLCAVPELNPDDQILRTNEFRATIHVPLYVGREELVQVVDYYDERGKRNHRLPGAGRTFSIRYGIVGRAWREQKARYDPKVTTKETELVQNWGMTFDEAKKAGKGRQTFLAVRILDEYKQQLAIVYMDANDPHIFDSCAQHGAEDDIDDSINVKRANDLEEYFNERAASLGLLEPLTKLRDAINWNDDGLIKFGPQT